MFASPTDIFLDIMFTIVPIVVTLGFVFVIGMFLVHAVRGAKQWKRNNESPVLTVDARVAAKRMDVHHFHHAGADNIHHMSSSTTYYATFEVESGDRLELKIRAAEYGMLAENDTGKLIFQGTRYLGFTRNRMG